MCKVPNETAGCSHPGFGLELLVSLYVSGEREKEKNLQSTPKIIINASQQMDRLSKTVLIHFHRSAKAVLDTLRQRPRHLHLRIFGDHCWRICSISRTA